ncbi:glutathione S-transferase family protein [Pseudoxanthomonas composti]|uniref:Glutathione S-transferase family protein n=1 Tax=Pseudoxanthomonas composti TaxID=2137479 RepID=A0A4Q1JYZ9_9GAMM|nr:glutathione S-transferase family protein [Pseudoxanthomonas composti]RXR08299.1 glutathione S-transferase family protein [Pseudoxanthomonas composti]
MSETLILYTHPMSRGRTTRWMLEETGLPYEVRILDYGSDMKSADFLAINPMGKVPALRHGEAVVTETAAICAYLAELVPERRLAPPEDSPERAAYFRWLFFMAGPFEAFLTAKESSGLADPVTAGYGTEEALLRTMEQAVQDRTHLAGDRFTAVDLLVAAYLGYYLRIGLLESRPAFVAFAQTHLSRPAAVRAMELDNALIPQHPNPNMPAPVAA